jgi:ATPase subunit of ABC transporter with duplicated ATPase domains
MIELELKNIKKYFGANLILNDISFSVERGEKVAIVGRNGCGKSTIFNIITNEENYDEGDLLIRKGSKIGYLKQINSFNNCTVIDVLNSAFKDLVKIEESLKKLENSMNDNQTLDKTLSQYASLQEKYEILGGYEKDTRINKVCEGLNIKNEMREKEFNCLSGGEKTTVMLAKILIENPNILLLDEPSNHLDMKSIDWLEGYLKDYKGSVIIISHDRYFLDRTVNKIIEIENLNSKTYYGNFSKYVNKKEEDLKLLLHEYNEQQKEINKMEESIKRLKVFSRNGENEKFIKRANSMQKRLDKIEKIDISATKSKQINLDINNCDRGSSDIVIMKDISKCISDKKLFKNANFNLRYGEKLALIGENGSGKSTLIDIIIGKQSIDSGYVKIASNKSLGYLPQNIEFEDDKISIIDWFRENCEISDANIRQYLAKFMFTKESVFKKVGSLSGGEKTRLTVSKMLYNKVNLLILDEPTNHLDISSIEVLEKAILDFKGTVLFVSHDRYFINKIADKVVELDNYIFNEYLGNYDYYKSKKEESIKINTSKNINKEYTNKKEKPKEKLTPKVSLKNIEREIVLIEKEIKEVDSKLSLLDDNYEKINELYQARVLLNEKLEDLMQTWLNNQQL